MTIQISYCLLFGETNIVINNITLSVAARHVDYELVGRWKMIGMVISNFTNCHLTLRSSIEASLKKRQAKATSTHVQGK